MVQMQVCGGVAGWYGSMICRYDLGVRSQTVHRFSKRGCGLQLQLGDVKHPCAAACPHPNNWIRSPALEARVRSLWHNTCR